MFAHFPLTEAIYLENKSSEQLTNVRPSMRLSRASFSNMGDVSGGAYA